MKFNGTATINTPRERVWAFLTDATAVSACVPGLEDLDIIMPQEHFKATAMVGFGSMQLKFTTDVHWLQLKAPESATMTVHAEGSGSTVDLTAQMKLTKTEEEATVLDWEADVTIVGQFANFPAPMMQNMMHSLTGMFFRCVQQNIEQQEMDGPTRQTDA